MYSANLYVFGLYVLYMHHMDIRIMAHVDKEPIMITSSSLSTCCAQHIMDPVAITGLQLHTCQKVFRGQFCFVKHEIGVCSAKHDGVLSCGVSNHDLNRRVKPVKPPRVLFSSAQSTPV